MIWRTWERRKRSVLLGGAQKLQQRFPRLAETTGKDVVEKNFMEETDSAPLAHQHVGGDQTIQVGIARGK